MSLGIDIKAILVANGITQAIYVNDIPSNIVEGLGIFYTGGDSPIHTMGAVIFRQPSFQIIIRGTGATSESIAESIIAILDGLTETTVNSNTYAMFRMSTDLINLGKSEAGYHQMSLNFKTMIT